MGKLHDTGQRHLSYLPETAQQCQSIRPKLIELLPNETTSAIHDLLAALWASGLMPTKSGTSYTVLVHKHKGTKTDRANYMPIGLSNTLYKLLTRMVTVAL